MCHAAGLLSYHFIERRMAPLSASLAGVVLPHDHLGNYLDDQGRTINNDLELKNFGKAGDVLVEIFNNLSEYLLTTIRFMSIIAHPRILWIEAHCSINKYCLQIAKCDNRSCCKPPRCYVKQLINCQFLPAQSL